MCTFRHDSGVSILPIVAMLVLCVTAKRAEYIVEVIDHTRPNVHIQQANRDV